MTTPARGVTAVLNHLPGAIERVRREIVLARFLGKLAVDQGARELRQRVEAVLQAASATAGDESGGGSTAPLEPDDAYSGSGSGSVGGDDVELNRASLVGEDPPATEATEAIAVGSLALSDYDHLPASDIVSKLASLEPAERAAIEAYERRNRGRRTVLGKLRQLDSEESS